MAWSHKLGSFCLSLTCIVATTASLTAGQEKSRQTTGPAEKVKIQYRVARDAFGPSRFLAVIDGGLSVPLVLIWDLPKLNDKGKKEVQEKQKKEFDNLIKRLEANQINGVEFECQGEWLKKGFKLRITSVPQPTEGGRKTLEGSTR